MTEERRRLSHTVVRTIATVTLVDLGFGVIADVRYPSYSQVVANSWVGTTLVFWSIGASLLLPLYVGVEAWWIRKSRGATTGLWIDAALAAACLVSLAAMVVYAFGHYAML